MVEEWDETREQKQNRVQEAEGVEKAGRLEEKLIRKQKMRLLKHL